MPATRPDPCPDAILLGATALGACGVMLGGAVLLGDHPSWFAKAVISCGAAVIITSSLSWSARASRR